MASALGDKAVKTRKNTGSKDIYVYYYIDINKALNALEAGEDIDDAFVSVSEDKKKVVTSGKSIDLTSPEKEYENFYFPCRYAFNPKQWERGLYNFGNDQYNRYLEFSEKVIDPIQDYQLPLIVLDKGTDMDAVCLIFEKVNTGGVSLTVFDLLTAKYAASDFKLRKNWQGDGKSIGISQQLGEKFLLKDVEPKEFLQAISLRHTGQSSEKAPSEKAMLSLPLDAYKELAPKIKQGFLSAADFLRKEGFTNHKAIPYRPQIVLLAAILSQFEDEKSWMVPKNHAHISRWFWCGVFGSGYKGGSHGRMVADYRAMLEWIRTNYQSALPPTISDESFFADDLYTMKSRQNSAYKGLNALVAREAEDFYFSAAIREMDEGELSALDIHHIFPKKWCRDNPEKVGDVDYDCIINKTLISSTANRKIGGKGPSQYLVDIGEDVELSADVMDKTLESHLIDPKALREDNFEGFFKARRDSLLELIKSAGVRVRYDSSESS